MAQARNPEPPSPSALTVSQCAARIASVLGAGIPEKLRIVGEVSGFRERTHWYFDLKDAESVLNCVMFAGPARKTGFVPRSGQQVVLSGRIDFYQKQGKVTVIVEKIEPVGEGALDLALKAMVEDIRRLGWLDESRKRPIPTFPRAIAIVTSRSGAALQDVLDTMRRRCPAVAIRLVDARVQGDGAAEEVAAAIRWLGTHRERIGIDAILVTRGGGSKEDLWAFNERIVAEAIVTCPVPVVAAIGHETDTTVAELVADLRCATPTQAAMRLTPDRDALGEQADAIRARLVGVLSQRLRTESQRLESAARRPSLSDPRTLIERERRHLEALVRTLRQAIVAGVRTRIARLERLAGRVEAHRPAALQARRQSQLAVMEARLHAAVRNAIGKPDMLALQSRLIRAWATGNERAATRLESLDRQVSSIGPVSVLKRGFSYTMRADGVLIRSVSDARAGDSITTTVADGQFASVVGEGSQTPAPRRRPPRPAPQPKGEETTADQLDLFRPDR